MLKEISLEELLLGISSNSPAPGGGSVAALSGCFGAALISMVCNLTIGKKKYQDVEDEFKGILEESMTLEEELLTLSVKDVDAFNEVMAAYRLPDGEEKNKRLKRAYQEAARIPLVTAKKCARLIELARITTRKGNKNALTDSGVGALMAYSGLKGAIYNVRVNLKEMGDDDFTFSMKEEVLELEKNAKESLDDIMGAIERNLSSPQR
ncbi:MAG: cyclodeaminase/cyclohydrolase family protein [Methanomassiliicoccales archaeon]|nr:MAG: cyclodeaminase/cyclohydrolase family protein [Methanomassiliicoccales archaeon]